LTGRTDGGTRIALRIGLGAFAVAAVAATGAPDVSAGVTTAQPSQSVAASVAGARSSYFKTPSGNIVCWYDLAYPTRTGATRPLLVCAIHSGLKPKPPYTRECRAGRLDHNADRISLWASGRAEPVPCSGDAGPFVGERGARVLGYGRTWSAGGLRCTSAITGLTCRNKSGHGFFLSREKWRSF
jgi:hypothetical protein